MPVNATPSLRLYLIRRLSTLPIVGRGAREVGEDGRSRGAELALEILRGVADGLRRASTVVPASSRMSKGTS